MLNLHPFNKIILKPRSETIIKARTDQNRIGIVCAEEKAPGVYIGNCIVNAADYTCPVSVINTTDREVEMQTPLIALEEIEKVIYLGHIISENGISPDPSKLTAIKEFPTLKKVKGVQSFIGLAGYYRKFMEDFSKIAKPLTKLTKKTEKFEWTTEQQNAFEILKEKLMTAPVLRFPDFNQEFTVTTDASDYADNRNSVVTRKGGR
ncbi:hypothetical protein ACFW04_013259 [Cataglyphis niger]